MLTFYICIVNTACGCVSIAHKAAAGQGTPNKIYSSPCGRRAYFVGRALPCCGLFAARYVLVFPCPVSASGKEEQHHGYG